MRKMSNKMLSKLVILNGVVMLGMLVHLTIALSEEPSSLTFSQSLYSPECKTWHDNIEEAFENENYCETDSDCKGIKLGGGYVDFGCFKYVNKDVVKDEIYKELDAYNRECTLVINKCVETPTPVCISKRCVASGD